MTSETATVGTRKWITVTTHREGHVIVSFVDPENGFKAFAKDRHLHVGSALTVQSSSGKQVTVTVRGIYDPPQMDQLLGQVSITRHAFDGAFTLPQNAFTFLAGGSQAALPIWTAFMKNALAGRGNRGFAAPSGVVFAVIDPETGQLGGPMCPKVITEAFLEGTDPTIQCERHQDRGHR